MDERRGNWSRAEPIAGQVAAKSAGWSTSRLNASTTPVATGVLSEV